MAVDELLQQAALALASSALFTAIILIFAATSWAEVATNRQETLAWWMQGDVGTTILVVRVLQGLLTAVATTAICSAFTRLHWRKMHGATGLSIVELVALSPTTLLLGTLRVVLGPHSGGMARMWASLRLCLTVMPWLGGMLLFARTSLVTVFDTATVYDVTSGIGPFNASYVSPFLEALTFENTTDLPYTYSSLVHNLITDSLWSTIAEPLRCEQSERNLECASYLMSGGLGMVAPWTPAGNEDYSLVRIPQVPAIQAEFQGRSGPKDFAEDECTLFGSNDTLIAAELCLSATSDGSLRAGLFLCNGITSGLCVSSSPQPNLTTTLTLHSRTATLLSSRSNLTILSHSDLSSPPNLLPFDTASSLPAYRSALSWLVDYPRSGIPAPSSILEIFWSNQNSLNDTYIDGLLLQNFRSLLAFPVWLFNANNYGNAQVEGRVLNPGLPQEFYTTAAVVKPLVKLNFDSTLVTVFVVLEGVVLVVLWGTLLWLFVPWRRSGRSREGVRAQTATAFPALEFLLRAEADVGGVEKEELRKAGSKQVVRRFGGVRIYANAAAAGQESEEGTGKRDY